MLSFAERRKNRFECPAKFRNSSTCLVVLFVSVTRMPVSAAEMTDCREMSGYMSGAARDTCVVQLSINGTEADIISSLRAKYHEIPRRCHVVGKNVWRSCRIEIPEFQAPCSTVIQWSIPCGIPCGLSVEFSYVFAYVKFHGKSSMEFLWKIFDGKVFMEFHGV